VNMTVKKIRRRIEERMYEEVCESGIQESNSGERGRITSHSHRNMTINEKAKAIIKRIPLVSNVARWLYRIKQMPWRVQQCEEGVQTLLVNTANTQHALETLKSSIESLKSDTNSLKSDIATVGQVADSVSSHLASLLVQLHEKTDSYVLTINDKLDRIKPVICAGNNLVITNVDGFIMGFPAEEWRLPAYQIIRGNMELGLVKVFSKCIDVGNVIVDVGANVGMYTLIAVRQLGAEGRVYSFEPTPRTFDILKNNIQVNGYLETNKIILRQAAVSDKLQRKAKFFVHKEALTHNTLYQEAGVDCMEIEIETVALDDVLKVEKHVDVIKIDAEGAEPLVLRGMRETIANNPHLIVFMEFAPSHLHRAGTDVSAFITEIRNYGFTIRQVIEPTGEVASINDKQLLESYSINLMLTRE